MKKGYLKEHSRNKMSKVLFIVEGHLKEIYLSLKMSKNSSLMIMKSIWEKLTSSYLMVLLKIKPKKSKKKKKKIKIKIKKNVITIIYW